MQPLKAYRVYPAVDERVRFGVKIRAESSLIYIGSFYRERAVEPNGEIGLCQSLFFYAAYGVKQLLRPADRKGRNDHIPAALERFVDNGCKRLFPFAGLPISHTVAVGGFDYHRIGAFRHDRIAQKRS